MSRYDNMNYPFFDFVAVCAIVVLALLLWRISYNNGKKDEKLKNAKDIIKDQEKGNKAIERTKRNKSIIDKLRERYDL